MSKPRTKPRALRRSRARHRRQEGMALLVIMLIIMMTTAAAAVSVQNTTAEMQAAGKERVLAQARYGAEAAMQATIAWIDLVGNSGSFLDVWTTWGNLEPPEVRPYTGGHVILNNDARHHAARSLQLAQAILPQVISPVSGPNPGLPIPDFTGSFGPSQPYAMEPYVVDITDCFEAPKSMTEGGNMNLSAAGVSSKRFFCTLTARGRIVMNGGSGAGVTWDLPGGMNGVFQERSGAAHDTRATMLLPEMLLPNN